jgi:hypothetical protein
MRLKVSMCICILYLCGNVDNAVLILSYHKAKAHRWNAHVVNHGRISMQRSSSTMRKSAVTKKLLMRANDKALGIVEETVKKRHQRKKGSSGR